MGVTVWDREMVWFVSDGRNQGANGYSGYVRDERDRAEVDVVLVENLLEERTRLRRERDFDGADAVREELNAMGIAVFDKDLVWRVKFDRRSGPSGARDQNRDFGPLGHDYVRAANDNAELDEAKIGHINDLIARRLQAKISRNFGEADALRDQLRAECIAINDKTKEWSVDADAYVKIGPNGHNLERASDDEAELDDEMLERINALLKRRLESKISRRFDDADAALSELNDDLGVWVSDKLKSWRADGKAFPTHVRGRDDEDVPSSEVAAFDEAGALELISARALHKRAAEYEAADEIVDKLRSEYNVVLDDKRGTYRLVRQYGGYFRVGARLPSETLEKVAPLLERRTTAKEAQDYETADALQDEISSLGISLDSRMRTFRAYSSQRGSYQRRATR